MWNVDGVGDADAFLGKKKLQGCSEVKQPGPGVMLDGTCRCREMTAPGERPELIE